MTPRVALHYRCAGAPDRPPVLFLHGFMGSGSDWDEVVARLSDRYCCVTIDLPGHGGSVRLPEPAMYTFTGAAAAVLGILRALHVRAPMLVGFGMGGRLALALAVHTPGTFRRVLIVSSSAGLADPAERASRAERDDALAAELETGDLSGFVERWYAAAPYASLAARPAMLAEVKAANSRQDPGELARALRGMGLGRQPSYWDRLSTVSAPLLTVAGLDDERHVDLGGEIAGRCVAGCAAIVPAAGHHVHRENPDALARLAAEFLA